MRFDIVTLFPEMFSGPFDKSIIARAKQKGLVEIELHDLRKWAIDERGTVDDRPYGGGVGMVLQVQPIFAALKHIKDTYHKSKTKTILLDPRGQTFTQAKAREYAELEQVIFVCGRYEGVDQRVADYLVDESLSIGQYVLTGGEIPTMAVVDAVTRLIPGVLEKPEATILESFSSESKLEHAQYTRPEIFNGWEVPKVLLSGDHQEIDNWRNARKDHQKSDH